mgnify:FL=1|tara:strand:+ start:140 stop:931 length:792 start_codon:yes stop_codon:yes gene_type:complete
MTTEKDNIEQTETKVDETTDTSVQSETEESTPDLLEQAVQKAEATAETEEQPSYLTKDDVERILEERKSVFDNAQGRAQQYTNQKVQEIQEGAKAQISEFMNDFSSILDEDQKEVLNQKVEERTRKAKEEKLDRLLENMDKPQQGSGVTPDNLEDLESAVKDTASALGLNIDVRSNKEVWKGWDAGMSFSQSVRVANANLKALAQNGKQQPVVQEAASQKVPPSTQGAPTQPKRAYRSIGDLSNAFANGQINANDYRELKKNL